MQKKVKNILVVSFILSIVLILYLVSRHFTASFPDSSSFVDEMISPVPDEMSRNDTLEI